MPNTHSPAARRGAAGTRLLLTLVVALTCVAVPTAAQAAWRTQTLSTAGTQQRDGWNPAVAVAADGTAIAVWEGRDANGAPLLFSRRVNGTWTAPAAVPTVTRPAGAAIWHPQLALLPGGGAVVVWLQRDANPDPWEVRAVAFDGTQWGAVEPVASAARDEGLAVTADAAGVVTAAWARSNNGLGVSRRAINGTWAMPTTYANAGGSLTRSPSLVAAANGDVTVVWTADGADHLPYARWTAGAGWSGATQSIPFPSGFNTPWWSGTAVVADASGNVTAAWTQCRYVANPQSCHPTNSADNAADMRVGTARFDATSSTWSVSSATGGDPAPGSPIYEGRNPSLAQLPDGSVVAVWAGGDDGTKSTGTAYASRWSAGAWSTPSPLGTMTAGSVAIGGYTGGATALWSDGGDIRASTMRGGQWSSSSVVATGERGRIATAADLAQDGYPVGSVVSFTTAGSDADGAFWRVNALDLLDLLPAAPTGVTAASVPGGLRISWNADPGPVAVTGYTATATGGATPLSCTATAPATTCDIAGAVLGVSYTITVTATSGRGSGPASDPAGPVRLSDSKAIVYWGNCNDATIAMARVDGSESGNVIDGTGRPGECPWATAVDAALNRLYWIDWTGGGVSDPASKLWVSDLDGSNAEVLYTDGVDGIVITSVNGLVVDTAQSPARLYWVNWDRSIGTALADGSGDADVLFPTADPQSNVVVDSANGWLYWAEPDTRIRRGNIDGTGTPQIITDSCPTVTWTASLAVDPTAGRIYRHAQYGGSGSDYRLQSMALDGSDCSQIGALQTSGSTNLALDAHDRRLYFDDEGTRIRFVSLDDPTVTGVLDPGSASADYVNLPVVLSAPMADRATALESDGTRPGATLTCATASWLGDDVPMNGSRAARTSAVSWTRDGAAIPGADGATLVAEAVGSYACVTTGTNVAGSTRSVSDPVVIAVPASAVPASDTPASASTSPDAASGATGGRPARAAGIRVRRGWPKQVGNVLITRVDVPAAGSITQIAYTRQGGRKVRACTGRVSAARAGRVVVRCVLDLRVVRAAARSVRQAVAVPVDVRTTFTPATGGTPSVISTATVVREAPMRTSSVTG